MKLKILKYNKDKAIGKFIYFKFLELLGLFIFIFGFENFGRFMYYRYDWLSTPYPHTYMEFWCYGFISLCLILFILVSAFVITYATIYILIHWFKLNWRWAKLSSEDEDSKIERLSEEKKLKEIKKIEKIEEDRKKNGYCVGDRVLFKEDRDYPEGYHAPDGKYGKEATISKVNQEGHFDLKGFWEGSCHKKEIAKVTKRIPIPKKPKLNKIREKEVNDRKKKK